MLRKLLKEMVRIELREFLEDTGKLCVVLMGLPAAGKSTWINNEAQSYIPGFKGYSVTNSDSQVQALQYDTGVLHYNFLKKEVNDESRTSEKKFNEFIKNTAYTSNRGKTITFPYDFSWWLENKDKGSAVFYKQLYKPFYASFFDIRDLAKKYEKDLFQTKIHKAGKLLVIDTVASKPTKILSRLKKTRQQGYHNIIVYLDIYVELAVARDKWREKHVGRGVGANVIDTYSKNMGTAYKTYAAEGKAVDGLVDRLMYFKWKPSGDSPIKGVWNKKEDNRYSLKRKLAKIKQNKGK
jgi:predicted kinase